MRLGPNAYGEQLRPGRVADCYLVILLDQPLAEIAPEPGRVLVVAPAVLLHEQIPQPEGQVLYDLLTGHPDRAPRDLVFLADLTAELRAWPKQTWIAVGISPEVALLAVVDRWRAGQIKGLEVGGVSVEEARALGRPAMSYVRDSFAPGSPVRSAASTCAGCIRPAAAGQASGSCRRPRRSRLQGMWSCRRRPCDYPPPSKGRPWSIA